MKLNKLINLIVLPIIGLTTLGIAGGIMLSSYLDWKAYFKENYPDIDPADYAKLQSVEASLKSGVHYYKNNLARPKAEDILLVGTYVSNSDHSVFTQVIDPVKRPYKVSTDALFFLEGGDITITYKDFVLTIEEVQLIDVVFQGIKISEAPYKVSYIVGETFDKQGMVVSELYNDGSTKVIANDQYSISNANPLTLEDREINITYTKNAHNYSVVQRINVYENLDNSRLISIEPLETFYVTDGERINFEDYKFLAKYTSGNKKILPFSEYTVSGNATVARLGKIYSFDVTSNINNAITSKLDLNVVSPIPIIKMTQTGGKFAKETKYEFVGNELKEVGKAYFVGGFGDAVKAGKDAKISFNVTSYTHNEASINLRCANSFLRRVGSDYYMNPLQINTIADLYVNNEIIEMPDDVVLAGCGPHNAYAPLYNVYSDFVIPNIALKAGQNTISLQFKTSTVGDETYWHESPSTLNIESFEVVSAGKTNKHRGNIVSIEFLDSFSIMSGQYLTKDFVPVLAHYEDETSEVIANSLLDIEMTEGIVRDDTVTISATLLENSEITITQTFDVVKDIYLEAENAFKEGSNRVENETGMTYSYNSLTGSFVPAGNATYVIGLDASTSGKTKTSAKYNGDTSLTFKTDVIEGEYALSVRAANTYYWDDGVGPHTANKNISELVDIYINGTKIDFNVDIPGVDSLDNDSLPWVTFFELDLADVYLANGENLIEINCNKNASKNKWNERSIPRFDYFKLSVK